MVSNLETAKRVLVTLLKSLAGIYSVVLGLTRESTNTQVKAAYKKVSLKAHPDQGIPNYHLICRVFCNLIRCSFGSK